MKPVACDRYYELLSARVDRELTRDEAEEVELHLVGCAQCRIVWEQMEEAREAFAHLEEVPAPEGFAQGVMDRIRAEEKPKVIPLFKRPQVRALAGLAACLVLVVGLYGAARPRHLDKMEILDGTARSFGQDAVEDCTDISAQESLGRDGDDPRVNAALAGPETEDAPQIAAYAAPETDTYAGMEKTASGAVENGSGDWPLMEGITCLERMPEGAEELIPPETAVTPTEDRRGSIYLDLPLEVLDQIELLAKEQGIGVTAERCSDPEMKVQYNLVILQ